MAATPTRDTRAIRLLITGADGFVGRHVLRAIATRTAGPLSGAAVQACARTARADDEFGAFAGLDVTEPASIDAALGSFRPTHVLHLAGIATTSGNGSSNRELWGVNTFGPLNVAHALKRHDLVADFVFVSSGLVYGDRCAPGQAASETTLMAPGNPYAVTKAAADLALGAETRNCVKIIRLRPFNHTGAGQSEDFVIPRFAAQIARIEAGLQQPTLNTGDLTAERDYLDVADVVEAYLRTIERSDTLPSGLVLNIASGTPQRIGAMLDRLVAMSRVPLTIESEAGVAPDAPVSRSVGDATAARRLLDWAPSTDFDTTLRSVLDHWRRVYPAPCSAPYNQS